MVRRQAVVRARKSPSDHGELLLAVEVAEMGRIEFDQAAAIDLAVEPARPCSTGVA